jgi:outer membrane receptor protein involved in Fe transport
MAVATSAVSPFPYVAAPAPGITNPAIAPAPTSQTLVPLQLPGSATRSRPILGHSFLPLLQSDPGSLRLDPRRGLFTFNGHTDVKELALYIRDVITKGNWSLNLGLRGDLYNGLTIARQAEPRLGVAYNVKKTHTILRVSYARTLESPFNENLILSSIGCSNAVLSPLLLCSPARAGV